MKKILGLFILLILLVGCGITNNENNNASTIDDNKNNEELKIIPTAVLSKNGDGSTRLTYVLENKTNKDHKVVFNGGNQLSYIIKNEEGKEVFNSNDLMQTLPVEEKVLVKNGRFEYIDRLEGTSDLPNGIYSVDIGFKGIFENDLVIDIITISDYEINNEEPDVELKNEDSDLGLKNEESNVELKKEDSNVIINNSELNTNSSDLSKPLTQEVEGKLTGWADGHTVEILVGESYEAFQVLPEVVEKLSSYEDGSDVIFSFTNDGISKTIVIVE